LAGAQSIHTNSLDEPIGLPTDRAVRIALRTQQIIAEETGVTNTIDPLGGSYYLETLTNEIESRTLSMISDIEEIGVITGIENGWFRERIYSTDARRAKLTELGEKVVVGVNKYRLDADVPTDVLVIDQGYEEEEVLRIKQFRRNRTNDLERSEMLETVRSAANAETNVIEPLIAAVEVGCTMGEMADVLKDVYGEWEPGWRLA